MVKNFTLPSEKNWVGVKAFGFHFSLVVFSPFATLAGYLSGVLQYLQTESSIYYKTDHFYSLILNSPEKFKHNL